MFEGYPVEFCMKQMVLEGGAFDSRMHYCKVIRYDAANERICMLLRGEEIEILSLDAIYSCKIMDGESYALCSGFIVERYLDKQGNMFIFRIVDGFYKNSVY